MLMVSSDRQRIKHKVVIAGSVYHLVSDEPEHIVKTAAARLDALIQQARAESGCSDVTKLAVLVALNLVQEQDKGQLRLLSLITHSIDQVA